MGIVYRLLNLKLNQTVLVKCGINESPNNGSSKNIAQGGLLPLGFET
jgi:hypothetical protein